ncbi:hypothetical protein FQN57_005011 [Myotisia sp. PD_48]|nr:hypothetical protein FQN57_005011 [Myotisia sp. PD_48]
MYPIPPQPDWDSRGRKRSARSPPSSSSYHKSAKKTKRPSAYDRNFQQILINNGFYPDRYQYPNGQKLAKPANWTEIQERLHRRRASLSPTRFNDDDFENFQHADTTSPKEAEVMLSVISTIQGNIVDSATVAVGQLFQNLAPLIQPKPYAEPVLAYAKPDSFCGARPEQLRRPIRDYLSDMIIPSTRDSHPILPNFLLEVKGPDGTSAVVSRQSLYNGALGARAMHELQTYSNAERIYDTKAYTITATYLAGMLKLYSHHIIPSAKPGWESETVMTLINAYALVGSRENFVQGVSAYRNLRDWAKEQRDQFIEDANDRYFGPYKTSRAEQELVCGIVLPVTNLGMSVQSDETGFLDAVEEQHGDEEADSLTIRS